MAFEGSVQDKFKLKDILNKSYIQLTVDEIKTETDNILGSLLLYHTERGEYSIVKGLLESQVPVNTRNKDCLTPLHVSIQRGHDDIFELLLLHRADLAAISKRDICPVYTAAEYNRPQMLQRILELDPSQISQRDSYNSLPVHVAAYKGHLQCLEVLINSCDDCGINTGNLFGFTPLHFAVQNQQCEALQLLLKHGANPNEENLFGYHPLHLSAVTGDLRIAKELIRGSALIDKAADNKATPLFLACCLGQEDVAKYFLQKRANGNLRGPGGNTPLHAACYAQHPEITEVVLDSHVEVNFKNDKGESPLHIFASCGSVIISRLLIENHCDVDGVGLEGDTPLHTAIRSGQKEIVQLLIEAGTKTDIPNLKGETASELLKTNHLIDIELKSGISSFKGDQFENNVSRASEPKTDNQNLIREISSESSKHIQFLPKVNFKQYSNFEKKNLFEAINKNDFENFKYIIEPCYDLNFTDDYNFTLLHSVIEDRNLIFLKFLLDFPIDLNVENYENKTPFDLVLENSGFWFKNDNQTKILFMKKIINSLTDVYSRYGRMEETLLHFASECENLDLINLLFERGALVNVRDKYGSTPLHISSEKNCLNASEALINFGAEVNQKTYAGQQPIHLAADGGHVPIIDLLIRKGADINKKDNFGSQPLHFAALNGHTEVVKFLIYKGAEINGKNHCNQTPLHLATYWNKAEVVEILLSKNADVKTKDKDGKTPLYYIERDEIHNIYKKFYKY